MYVMYNLLIENPVVLLRIWFIEFYVISSQTLQSTHRGVLIKSCLKERKLFDEEANDDDEEANDEEVLQSEPARTNVGTQTDLSWRDSSRLETDTEIKEMGRTYLLAR